MIIRKTLQSISVVVWIFLRLLMKFMIFSMTYFKQLPKLEILFHDCSTKLAILFCKLLTKFEINYCTCLTKFVFFLQPLTKFTMFSMIDWQVFFSQAIDKISDFIIWTFNKIHNQFLQLFDETVDFFSKTDDKIYDFFHDRLTKLGINFSSVCQN